MSPVRCGARPTVTDNNVTIIGYTDLAGRLPTQASQLYSTNLVNLMKLLTPTNDGQLVLDFDDIVQRTITVVRDGARAVAATAGGRVVSGAVETVTLRVRSCAVKPPMTANRKYALVGLGAVLLFVLTAFAPNELIGHITVFVLAIVIGYYVIGNVHHALHTPLMSVTNAISGIIVVGALLQIGHATPRSPCCRSWRSSWPASTSSAALP